VNGVEHFALELETGKTYLLHFISSAALSWYFWNGRVWMFIGVLVYSMFCVDVVEVIVVIVVCSSL
jgi:hypothetical protein